MYEGACGDIDMNTKGYMREPEEEDCIEVKLFETAK